MRVDRIGSGTGDDPFRPDVPEGTPFSVVAEDDDGFEVELPPPYDRLAELESRIDAASALADKANATAQDVAQAMKPSGR